MSKHTAVHLANLIVGIGVAILFYYYFGVITPKLLSLYADFGPGQESFSTTYLLASGLFLVTVANFVTGTLGLAGKIHKDKLYKAGLITLLVSIGGGFILIFAINITFVIHIRSLLEK